MHLLPYSHKNKSIKIIIDKNLTIFLVCITSKNDNFFTFNLLNKAIFLHM